MEAQHPIHGAIGEAFEKLGGVDGMVEWAASSDKAKGEFYRMLPKLAPSMMPTSGMNGDVQITVVNGLAPTALDDIEGEAEEIEDADWEDMK